jgi:hypothetical protein
MERAAAVRIARIGGLSILVASGLVGIAHGENDPDRTSKVFTREVENKERQGAPPFVFNTLLTTAPVTDSPAYADILVEPGENFLKCKGGPFALCYYSGPEGLLPCDAKPNDTVAKCQCLEIAYGVYFVDINAILDVDTYQQTVQYCGKSGSDCTAVNSAPVCSIINANKLFPGADVISVFSFACAQEQGRGNTPCNDPALYAGCMTAPCYRKSGSAAGTVECLCPTFKGPFQVGKDDQSCDLGKRNVWSAAYTVPGGDGGSEAGGTSTAPNPDGCVPDDPNPDIACPLWSENLVTPLTPDSELCQLACGEYQRCRRDGIQLGFTCDATLCTAGCSDQGLVGEACSGLAPPACSLASIAAVEEISKCSCCASKICDCRPDSATNAQVFQLDQQQRDAGVEPQCDINGVLCGAAP